MRRNAGIRWLLFVVFAALATAAGATIVLERRFASLTPDPLDLTPGTHLWAHRGTHGGFQGEGRPMNRRGENTLDAFQASIRNGFTGVELDIHFLPETGFVVKHDDPTPSDLRLERVFEHCGRRLYYWLDFKNLDERNVDDVIAAFRPIFERYRVGDRVLIESREARALAKLRSAIPRLKVLYWVRRYSAGRGIRSWIQRTRERMTVAWFGFRNVSVGYYEARPGFLHDFARLGKYVFTVNDPVRMARLRDAGVRVILTDLDELPPGIPP